MDIITERDNATICPVRVGAVITAILYHSAAAYGLFSRSIVIDIVVLGQYMQHMMTLVGVGGAAIGAKSIMKGDA